MEIAMDFIVDIVIMFIVFYAGWYLRGIAMLVKLSRDPDSVIKALEQIKKINEAEEEGLPVDAVEVETEQVNDLIYAYNKATGEFLAQAQNLHQVMTIAASRYPGKKFWHPDIKQDSQTA